MEHTIRFIVKGHPKPKGSRTAFRHKYTGKVVTIESSKGCKPWMNTVAIYAQLYAPKTGPWTGEVELNVIFWMPKPKSHPKKKYVPHTKRPDVDKLMRAIQDALTGIFYADDSQVTSGYRRKAYADAPGIEVEIINVNKYREIEEAEKNDGRKESSK